MTAELFRDDGTRSSELIFFLVGWFCVEGDENLRAASDGGQFHIFGAMLLKGATDFHTIARVKQIRKSASVSRTGTCLLGHRVEAFKNLLHSAAVFSTAVAQEKNNFELRVENSFSTNSGTEIFL